MYRFRFEHPETQSCKFWKRNLLPVGLLKFYPIPKRNSTGMSELYSKETSKAYPLLDT